jgi:hypothetical protein
VVLGQNCFELFDLATNKPVLAKKYEATTSSAVVRPVAAGDLVVWSCGRIRGSPLQLCWI